MEDLVTGIQQAGIGVTDADAAKYLYKELFGMDVLVFDDKAKANLMTEYTGGIVHDRHAILLLNMGGGGGFELWQYLSRQPGGVLKAPEPGDLGIFALKIKTRDIAAAHVHYSSLKNIIVSPLTQGPDLRFHFWITDQYGYHFNLVEADDWFTKNKSFTGGVTGAVLGVSDMNKAIEFYEKVLGIKKIVYDFCGPVGNLPNEQGAEQIYRNVLLVKENTNNGAFSRLLGSIQLELLEIKEKVPEKIYAGRQWGDCGFIHLCFDVTDMDKLKSRSVKSGYPFTVDSADSFAMENSAGRFCYVEDPDGTMIELVETHKVPVLKKAGWYFNLKKRKKKKPLPDWQIKLLGLNKLK